MFDSTKKYRAIALRATTVFSISLLVATCFVPLCSAKYLSQMQGSANAHIARFSVEAFSTLDETLSLEMAPGDCKTIDVTVVNPGEVAVQHEITFCLQGDLPLVVQPTSSSVLSNEEPTIDDAAGTYTWMYETSPRQGTQTIEFELVWPEEFNSVIYAMSNSTLQLHVQSNQMD